MSERLKAVIEDRVIRVPFSGCWIWMGAVGTHGYGNANFEGKFVRVHRASYEAFIGEIPDGLFVLHRCDVPCCVNPTHLFVGTPRENTRDMFMKGRSGRPGRKLTDEQIALIRSSNASATEISAAFAISWQYVYEIRSGSARAAA